MKGGCKEKRAQGHRTGELMARDPFRNRGRVLNFYILLKSEHGGVKVYNLEICHDNISLEIHADL